MSKGMKPGSVFDIGNEFILDEVRIKYLQKQYKQLQEFHNREIREQEIRMRNRMHLYARACLTIIKEDIKSCFKIAFLQMEKLQE